MLQAAAEQPSLLSQVLTHLAAPAIVVGALAWLAKALITESLARESQRLREGLERHAAVSLEQVKNEAGQQLERVKHQFDLKLEEHKVRFSLLHNRRIDLIVQLFSGISNLVKQLDVAPALLNYHKATDWVDVVHGVRQAREAAEPALREARLLIPPAIADRAAGIVSIANEAEWAFVFGKDESLGDQSLVPARNAFESKLKEMDVKKEMASLGTALRALLAVEGQHLIEKAENDLPGHS